MHYVVPLQGHSKYINHIVEFNVDLYVTFINFQTSSKSIEWQIASHSEHNNTSEIAFFML